jgi:hypothetical protein
MLIVYHIKKDERKTVCSMHVREVNSKRGLVVNPEEFGPGRRRSRKWEGIIKMRVRIYDWKV